MSETLRTVVFCDFDGTITSEETFVAMLKYFTPEVSARVMPELYQLRMTLRQGVREMLQSIPSSRYQEIIDFSRTKDIRPGFGELLDYLDSENIPFVVVSGGLRIMVETVLAEWKQRVKDIYAVDVNTDGEYFQVFSPMEGETELVDKVKVMQLYKPVRTIAIGDSVTDLNMGMQADLVFARDRLAKYLTERGKSFIPWENFFDILQVLKSGNF